MHRRSLVGSLTAFSVLLCHIYCACGPVNGSAATPSSGAIRVPAEQSHCSAHSKIVPPNQSSPLRHHHDPIGNPSNDGSADDKPPCGEHPHHHHSDACQHCQPTVIAPSDRSDPAPSSVLNLLPIALPVEIASAFVAEPSASWRHLHGDLSPPACSTLLGLHCALVL